MTRLSSKSFHAEGIVIGKRNFFEADRIVEILTMEKGKVRAVVRGARKSKSKLAGSTELFTHGEFTFAKGKNLDIITAVTPLDYFQKAMGDLKKISWLFLMSETLEKLLPREVPNEEIFKETLSAFRFINRNEKSYLVYEYLYKVIVLLGYGLSLSQCSRCHEKKDTLNDLNNILRLESGGILCKKCNSTSHQTLKVSKNTIKLLLYIENNELGEYSKITFDKNVSRELTNIISAYLNHIYQKEFKSNKFIEDVKALK
ncbi:MAG: DNA repair protein RecO [Patescibacteria group bacterium]